MHWEEMTIRNFGPFVDVSISLDSKGLVCVEGDNQLSTSADSNGAGKSYLLEAVVWCLYGRTVRGQTGDDVVNHRFGPTPGNNCAVIERIRHGSSLIEIARYRRHKTGKNGVTVSIDGVDQTKGTNKETDKLIVDILGLDYDSFVRSVYFDGHKIVSFPTLADKEVKAVFERVLGLEELTRVADVVRRHKSEAIILLGNRDTQLKLVNVRHSTAQAEVSRFAMQAVNWQAEQDAKIKEKAKQADETWDSMKLIIPVDTAPLEARKAEIDTFILLAAGIGSDLVDINTAFNEVTTANNQAAVRKAVLDRGKMSIAGNPELIASETRLYYLLKEKKTSLASHTATASNASHKIGQPCGECGKIYLADDLGSIIEHAKKHMAVETTAIATIEQEIVDIKAAIEKSKNDAIALADLDIQREQLVISEGATLLASIVEKKSKLEAVLQGVSRLQTELAGIVAQIDAAKHIETRRDTVGAQAHALEDDIAFLKAQPNPNAIEHDRWLAVQTEAAKDVAEKEASIAEVNDRLATIEVLEKAYGRNGLKAHIIEQVTPILNMRANEYAARLADGSITINFSTIAKNKDGTYSERFQVTVKNDQGAESYLGNSSGECKKIDLAIAIAFADLVYARAGRPIDLWCADEIAESLDATALERVVELLRDKAKERGTLLCISHVPLSDYIPTVWTVKKTGDGSTISMGKSV